MNHGQIEQFCLPSLHLYPQRASGFILKILAATIESLTLNFYLRYTYVTTHKSIKEWLSDQTQQLNHSHEKSHYNKHMEGEQGHVTNITRPEHTYTQTMSNLLRTSPLKLRHE